MVRVRPAIAVLLLVVSVAACASTPRLTTSTANSERAAGNAVAVEQLDSFSHLTLRTLLWSQGFADRFPTKHGITLHRLEYHTTTPDGRLVPASALLVLPQGGPPWRGVVSWQHGTASLRTAAPSTPDLYNGILPGVVFAGRGYVVVAPDYLGFGISNEPHPYYHAPTTASVVRDALRAGRILLTQSGLDWPSTLFLAGFSQGGHASLAAARLLEAEAAEELTPGAVASVAGPIDLAGVAFPDSLAGRSRFASLYIAWIAAVYARTYGEPVDSVLREPWSQSVPALFDGTHDGDEIVAALPVQPRTMLTPSLLEATDTGGRHWFIERLHENSLGGWIPRVPVRLYYGNDDVDVPHRDAVAFAHHAGAAGADVTAISVGAFDHDATILEAASHVADWFDTLSDVEFRRAEPDDT